MTAAPIVINHQGMFPATTLSFNLQPGVALGDAVAAIHKFEQRAISPTRSSPASKERPTPFYRRSRASRF